MKKKKIGVSYLIVDQLRFIFSNVKYLNYIFLFKDVLFTNTCSQTVVTGTVDHFTAEL